MIRTHTLTIILIVSFITIKSQVQCWNDSPGLIPLTDLGTDYYEGYPGGLYQEGLNTLPYNHKKKGTNISKGIKPLDSAGNVNYESGKILFLGFGASVASNAFNAYLDTIKEMNYYGISDCLDLKGMFFGGKDIGVMIDLSDDKYWGDVRERMVARGDSYAQVQLIWLLQQSNDDTTTNFELYFDAVLDKYITLMQILKDTFPNLKQVFLSGMHYTGYMDPLHERYNAFVEPKGYWGNFVIKELVNQQINGNPALKFDGPAPPSAWLGWGPYFWADGKNPRAYDGLSWRCDQFRDDPTGGGFHLLDSASGEGIEASMLKDFFLENPVSSIWYKSSARWAACPGDTTDRLSTELKNKSVIEIYPNPSNSNFAIKLPQEVLNDFDFAVYNQFGQMVFQRSYSNFSDRVITFDLDLPNGIYFIQLPAAGERYTAKLVISN